MNYKFQIAFLVSLSLALFSFVTTRNTASKLRNKVMFYNVENLFDTINDPKTMDEDFTPDGKLKWNSVRYYNKLTKIRKVIEAVGGKDLPVLVGVCEIENKTVLQDLINPKYFKGNHYQIIHKDSPDERGIDVGLLYDEKVFTPIKTEFIEVILPDGDHTRDILWATGNWKGQVVNIFVNHWSSRRGGDEISIPKRVACANTLAQKIKQIYKEDPDSEIILLGDFNENPNEQNIVNLINNASINPKNPLINLSTPLQNSGQGSFIYDGNWNMIDQIIVTSNLLTENECGSGSSMEIFNPEWLQFKHKKWGSIPNRTYVREEYVNGYSDHFPVYMEFTKFK